MICGCYCKGQSCNPANSILILCRTSRFLYQIVQVQNRYQIKNWNAFNKIVSDLTLTLPYKATKVQFVVVMSDV